MPKITLDLTDEQILKIKEFINKEKKEPICVSKTYARVKQPKEFFKDDVVIGDVTKLSLGLCGHSLSTDIHTIPNVEFRIYKTSNPDIVNIVSEDYSCQVSVHISWLKDIKNYIDFEKLPYGSKINLITENDIQWVYILHNYNDTLYNPYNDYFCIITSTDKIESKLITFLPKGYCI